MAGARLHVVTLVDRLGTRGGAERLALLIAQGLDPERFRSTLCVSRWSEEEARDESAQAALADLRAHGVGFLPLGRQRKVDVWVWGKLVRFLRSERVDVLHAHKFGSNIWGTLVGRAARTPGVVTHEHTWSYVGNPVRRFLDRELVGRFSDAFVAVSRDDARKMREVEGVREEVIRFVPNGIEGAPAARGHDVRAELGLGPVDPVVTSVGFLRAQKAFDVLIRAAGVLRAEFPGLRVLIAGDGEERAALEALIAELGLPGTVSLLGRRLDVGDLLAATDVCAASSRFEGSPLSVMEYMAAGKPVVATQVGGVPDLIEEGVEGLLVPSGDHEALAAGLAALLRDPARARTMGEAGARRQRAEFDIAVMVRRLEELYEELLSPLSGGAGRARAGAPPRGSG